MYHLNAEFSSMLALLAEQSEGKLRTQVSMSLLKLEEPNKWSVALATLALAIWVLPNKVPLVLVTTGTEEGTAAKTR